MASMDSSGSYPQSEPADRHAATAAATPRAPRRVAGLAARFFPLVFFELYLATTLLLFALGPVEPEFSQTAAAWSYALLGQAFIALGFVLGTMRPARLFAPRIPVRWMVKLAILVAVCLLAFSIKYRNYADLTLLEALANPGAGYRAKQLALIYRDTTPLLSGLRALGAPFLAVFLPAGILFWHHLALRWRALWLAGLVAWIGEALVTGSSKPIFDLVLVSPWLLWLRRHHSPARSGRRSRLRRAIPLAAAVVLLFAGIEAFSYFTRSRSGSLPGEFPPERVGWSEARYGIELSEALEHRIYMVSRYLSFGYNGLAGSLELPFEWSKGVGHSGVLARWLSRLSSDPESLRASTYPARLERATGYSEGNLWHTIYPWVASDLTFPGALLFIGLMAFLFARVWGDCLRTRNLFAAGLLMQLILMFYYIPANNVRLAFSEELIAFWSLLALWLLTRIGRAGAADDAARVEPAASTAPGQLD